MSTFLKGFTYYMVEDGKGLAVGLYRGHHRIYIVERDKETGEFTYDHIAVVQDETKAVQISDFLHNIFDGGDIIESSDQTRH